MAAKIRFVEDPHPDALRLDFYLPDCDLHIECKQFHSERIAEQMSRAPNVLAVQGIEAARFLRYALEAAKPVSERAVPTPLPDLPGRLRDGADRFLRWVYRRAYAGSPVISIPRHPNNVDALLEEAAAHIEALQAKLAAANEQLARTDAGREAEAKAGWIARDKLAAAEAALTKIAQMQVSWGEMPALARGALSSHAVSESQNGGGDA